MPITKHPWHRCYLHGNHKFIATSPRTSRQAFGHNVDFDGHRKADTYVFWFAVIAAVIVAILELL